MAIIFNKSFISSFKAVFFPYFHSFFQFLYLINPIFQFFPASPPLNRPRDLHFANSPTQDFAALKFHFPSSPNTAVIAADVNAQNQYGIVLQARALANNPDMDQKKAPRRVLF